MVKLCQSDLRTMHRKQLTEVRSVKSSDICRLIRSFQRWIYPGISKKNSLVNSSLTGADMRIGGDTAGNSFGTNSRK